MVTGTYIDRFCFVVLITKHHDGFFMRGSKYPKPNTITSVIVLELDKQARQIELIKRINY